jgi:hypothetical protein
VLLLQLPVLWRKDNQIGAENFRYWSIWILGVPAYSTSTKNGTLQTTEHYRRRRVRGQQKLGSHEPNRFTPVTSEDSINCEEQVALTPPGESRGRIRSQQARSVGLVRSQPISGGARASLTLTFHGQVDEAHALQISISSWSHADVESQFWAGSSEPRTQGSRNAKKTVTRTWWHRYHVCKRECLGQNLRGVDLINNSGDFVCVCFSLTRICWWRSWFEAKQLRWRKQRNAYVGFHLSCLGQFLTSEMRPLCGVWLMLWNWVT